MSNDEKLFVDTGDPVHDEKVNQYIENVMDSVFDALTPKPPMSYEEMCDRMESEVQHIITGNAYWCEWCVKVNYDEREDKTEPYACPKHPDNVYLGDTGDISKEDLWSEVFDYTIQYNLYPELWDRGYLEVIIRDCSPNGAEYIEINSMEGTITVYDDGGKAVYSRVVKNVDLDLVDRLACDSIEEGLKYIREYPSLTKVTEKWTPKTTM